MSNKAKKPVLAAKPRTMAELQAEFNAVISQIGAITYQQAALSATFNDLLRKANELEQEAKKLVPPAPPC
jgi:hypothetical protein